MNYPYSPSVRVPLIAIRIATLFLVIFCFFASASANTTAKTENVAPVSETFRITPESVLFLTLHPGDAVAESFVVENLGSSTYYPDARLVDDTGTFFFRVLPVIEEIRPGDSAQFDFNFLAQSPGTYSARIVLGGGLPDVQLLGICDEDAYQLTLEPPVMRFDPMVVGDTNTQTVRVINTGLGGVELKPKQFDPQVLDLSPPTYLAAGDTTMITATFSPFEFGQYTFRIELNAEHDLGIDCVAPPPFDFAPDQNRVGFFFDRDLSSNEQAVPPVPQVITAYLAMFNPSNSSGIAGWECRIEPSAGAVLSEYALEGYFIDANLDPHEFTVGVGLEPLPYSPVILLGTFEFSIWDVSVDEIVIRAGPVANPTLHGLMAWVPWDSPEALVPLLPNTDSPILARITWAAPAAVETPTPIRVVQDRLLLNVPNPFNPNTTINYELAELGRIEVSVYDVMGRKVRVLVAGHRAAGSHAPVWDGRDQSGRQVPSGTYYVRLVTKSKIDRRKIMLIK